MISSSSNIKIKRVMNLIKKAKARKEEGLFVVEGTRMFTELPKERITGIFASTSFLREPDNEALLGKFRYEEVSDEAFKTMSDTQTPQGVLALVTQYSYELEDLLCQSGPSFLMILETIQDPGNLGTILRAGEGAGITGVLMDETTADIYNPKVIRSTMGSICRVPFVYTDSLKTAIGIIKKKGVSLYAAHLDGKNDYDQEDYTASIGFLIGNEASGLSAETAFLADTYVKIPMQGKVESLNAAVAASVLMFEASRQRRH